MAAEGDPNIRIQGSVRLVGDSPSSITPQSSTTANRSETSTSIMEITTTTTTASSRRVKQTTPREPQQVRSSLTGSWSFYFYLSFRGHAAYVFSPQSNFDFQTDFKWNCDKFKGTIFSFTSKWFKDIDGDMEVQFKVLSLVTRCTLFLSCGLCYKTDKTNMSGCLLACDQFLDSNWSGLSCTSPQLIHRTIMESCTCVATLSYYNAKLPYQTEQYYWVEMHIYYYI